MTIHDSSEGVTRILVGLFLGYGYFNTMRCAFPQQMHTIGQEMDIPLGTLGMPNSIFSAAYGVGKFFTSVASDYVPCSEFHALGLFLSGLAVAALGFCSDFGSMTALWGLQGVLQAFGWPFVARVIVTKLPEASRARYWGLLSMACNVGSMVAPYGIVLAKYCGLSWRGVFVSAGTSAIVVSVLVWILLCFGSAGAIKVAEPAAVSHSKAGNGRDQGAVSSVLAIVSSPVMVALMLCNMLSFGSSKCMKEWGAVYLRSTRIADTDLQVATLIFWTEVGGSCGAVLSGIISSRLGGRHALTCLLAALVACTSLGTLACCCSPVVGAEPSASVPAPMPFGVACALLCLSLAGVNCVRTLAGLHGAEAAASLGKVGMATACLEAVGQIGSVAAGQPLGALAAFVASSVDGQRPGLDAPAIGLTILSVLCIASGAMAILNAMLLPQEARRVALKTTKAE